ncbi:MAG: aspartate/tyrosine/aromatic aminotransferase [Gammaproteobacteria bacterium]|nr:MAG: aspartate/tyrosine/aromatic aminotransferase [Gammaproteobacteria bacterium]TLY86928.1 MAG: aspartate/tyrosine/aromatic aminotransferase [Gammaproteobacteria bacterium]
MFERLESVIPDPILGLMAAFRADPDPRKVDLGVGVYRDDRGETPVLEAVRRAESALLARQSTKTYVGPAGNPAFNEAIERLVLGEEHPTRLTARVRTVQAPGGCGALRLGAELIRAVSPDSVVYVSTPTWANHSPLLSGSGLKLAPYPYFDPATGGVQFAAMTAALARLPARAVVLLHASCHNPTGADLSPAQWRELLELLKRRQLLPFIDMAYQGLGEGLEADAYGMRLFSAELPEVLCAVSCSKNFGLYRERTGALQVINETPAAADAAFSHLVRIARGIWSMPPDHGAAIVHGIFADATLRTSWQAEVAAMRQRIQGLRHEVVKQLRQHCPQRDFGFIATQRGMFSFLGISAGQVRELRERHHVYMTDDSRMNIAGLRAQNLEYFARATAAVLSSPAR